MTPKRHGFGAAKKDYIQTEPSSAFIKARTRSCLAGSPGSNRAGSINGAYQGGSIAGNTTELYNGSNIYQKGYQSPPKATTKVKSQLGRLIDKISKTEKSKNLVDDLRLDTVEMARRRKHHEQME